MIISDLIKRINKGSRIDIYKDFDFLEKEEEEEKKIFIVNNWNKIQDELREITNKLKISKFKSFDLDFEKMYLGDLREYNELILKILMLHSEVDKETLGIALFSLGDDDQVILTEYLEERKDRGDFTVTKKLQGIFLYNKNQLIRL